MRADEAIVLVGGQGTRLRPLVSDLPKPLAPVGGRPFLAWVLDHLAGNGIGHVILATGYLAEKVECAIGADWRGMDVSYSIESEPLGTGGALRQARALLRGDTAHVLNGDTFLRYSLAGLAACLDETGTEMAVALASVPDVGRYGAVETEGGRVRAFREKGGSGAGRINAGCYFLGRRALDSLPTVSRFSFETDVLVPMTAAGKVGAFVDTTGFIDIGVPEDYLRAQEMFAPDASA